MKGLRPRKDPPGTGALLINGHEKHQGRVGLSLPIRVKAAAATRRRKSQLASTRNRTKGGYGRHHPLEVRSVSLKRSFRRRDREGSKEPWERDATSRSHMSLPLLYLRQVPCLPPRCGADSIFPGVATDHHAQKRAEQGVTRNPTGNPSSSAAHGQTGLEPTLDSS